MPPSSSTTQRIPLPSRCNDQTRSPARPSTRVNFPPCRRSSPPPKVPTHSEPSGSGQSAVIESLARPSVAFFLKTLKVAPSKRASPPSLPTHRQPSPDWATAYTVSCGRPFSVVQARWM